MASFICVECGQEAPAQAEEVLPFNLRVCRDCKGVLSAGGDMRTRRARQDALTGLPNREAFELALERTMASGEGFGLLYAAVECLLLVNDVDGPLAGDKVLVAAAGALVGVGLAHSAARVGGARFAAMSSCPRDGADEVARDAWEAMAGAVAPFDSEKLRYKVRWQHDMNARLARRRNLGQPRYLGVTLALMWVPPRARLTTGHLLKTMAANTESLRFEGGAGFHVVT